MGTAATMAIGGCVVGNDGGTGDSMPTVRVRSHADLGDILVGPDGLTLYMFEKDTRGASSSACTGGCADTWPPLTVAGTPTGGGAVTADLSTIERADGTMQVTGDGWPLYRFGKDEAPGDAMGQGVGGAWWVLGPAGTPIRSTPTPTAASGGSGGAY